METEVAIIGAGVLGVSLAFHLSHQGRSVILIEREASYAQHASGKNAGMFRQLYRHPDLTHWAYRSRLLWPEAVREVAFRETGSLVVGRTPPVHHPELFQARSVETSTGALPAVFTPTDGLFDPHLYLSTLFGLINRQFVTTRFRETVSTVKQAHSGNWIICCLSGTEIAAKVVVNAAGAWLNTFIEEQEEHVAAAPFARHLFVVDGFQADYMPQRDVGFYWDEDQSWYMRRWEGSTRLVSICDRAAANPDNFIPRDLSSTLSEKLLEALPEVAPTLRLAQGWHCFRTYTEDQLPLWGFDSRGMFWLAAFGGLGMSTSFAATLDAAEMLCGMRNISHPEFSPLRAQGILKRLFQA